MMRSMLSGTAESPILASWTSTGNTPNMATSLEALIVLKTVYLHIKSKATVSRPSYYVVGISLDSSFNAQLLNLMKTVFTPSMFISISHLSYSVRTFTDCRIFPVAMASHPKDLSRGTDYSYGHTVVSVHAHYQL
ncbi:hypothetical protein MRX96_007684 [Rhipicephalus microplus]